MFRRQKQNAFTNTSLKLRRVKATTSAFTIIELLIVIVVIGIISAIITISYIGVNDRAVAASMQSDLKNGSTQLELFHINNETYPDSLDETSEDSGVYCPNGVADDNCITLSGSNKVYSYTSEAPGSYELIIKNGDIYWKIEQSGIPVVYDPASEVETNKYVFTGVSTTNGSLNQYTWLENVVRDSQGTLHAVYNDLVTPAKAYYIFSDDNGLNWSIPLMLYSTTNSLYQPDLKIDSNDTLHFTTAELSSDYHRVQHRYKQIGGDWSPLYLVGAGHSLGDEVAFMPSPDISQDNKLDLVYDRSHLRGVGYRYWNGSWISYTGVLSASYDFAFQKTLSSGSNLFMFFRRTSTNTYLYMVKRVAGVWSISSNLTTFNSQYHDEILDSEGNIWMFVTDPTSTPYKIYYRKYTVATNTWGALTLLDIDTTYHAAYQSATVDSSGNIYVFYSMNDYDGGTAWQIYYKVFDKVSGIWSDRRQFTNGAEHGSAVFPKVRYQTNHQLEKDTIELTYRQNDIGSITYNLYYGRLSNP